MPILQLALDFLELSRALPIAREAMKGGVDWIEAGTPLIKSEGLDAIRALRREFPDTTLIADLKIMDAGRMEIEAAAKAGANMATVLGCAPLSTLEECIEAGNNYGIKVSVDLLEVVDPESYVKKILEMGIYHVTVHTPIDKQMQGAEPFSTVKLLQPLPVTIAVAGGIHSESAAEAVNAGADIVIVGGAITKAVDAIHAAQQIKTVMKTRVGIKTDLFKRESVEKIRTIFERVSTANLSDAMHRSGEIDGIPTIRQGLKLLGKAVTVRTSPGDWAKTVEAIDQACPGDVIVIDAGGIGPAVWGELATESALEKGLGGVIINGAIRDTQKIRKHNFPAFAKIITPTAGEPKGFGEINVPIKISGVRIQPGDWLVGDDDGLVCIPRSKAVEFANRAMDVLERENRIRKEIKEGTTLAEVSELLRWEKHS